jgi:hypothetical protein
MVPFSLKQKIGKGTEFKNMFDGMKDITVSISLQLLT